ncbi:DUF2510 domain-containing protein [Herbiconiux sp. KACC 21604]|uniref:DUF2510 domain-containing protein n=1 Tax=unclassified Herbiconiux TaxID=2618217 RepID=UPI0014921782|nr:DUF2510 domain-containing protein [Herbiconiux sp. SALV-R1]QJU55752.1 DUF2510 domain-containing protein [Herbiconiux sp. SALV-R1]WPO86960.1 DUF2510 domain-containing protein [Herbiconiux sp. KACC 21604]
MAESDGGAVAGWYPDPADASIQRYWDGTRWTEHVHPAPQAASYPPPAADTQVPGQQPAHHAPAPQHPAKPKRRRGLVIGLVSAGVAVVAVLALVAAFIVVPGITSPQASLYTDRSAIYDYTEPMLDLERDHEFLLDVDYDLDAVNAAHMEEAGLEQGERGGPDDWAVQVYYDAALTKPAQFHAFQLDPGADITISGSETGTAFGSNAPEGGRAVMDETDPDYDSYQYGQWGLHDEYFLVTRVEKDGSPKEKPVVTRFTVTSELEAPDVTFSDPAGDGTVTLSWDPVDGADSYIIVTASDATGDSGNLSYVTEVDGTEWSSATDVYDVTDAPWVTQQNVNLQAFSYRAGSDDQQDGNPSEEYEENVGQAFDLGVIATDGAHYSPYTPHDLVRSAGSLPYEVAFYAAGDLKKWGASGYIEGIENVQTVLPFTGIDGRTRSTVAYIDDTGILDYGDRWIFPLRGRGTQLGEWIPVTKRSTPDPVAAAAQFNAAAEAAAPDTGLPRFEAYAPPENVDDEPLAEAPPTDYPVYGSTDFTKYLAQHMIAQTKSIDISEYVDQPGAPDPYDAAMEARYQNPYVFNVNYMGLRDGGDTLLVTYSIPTEEVKALQANLKQRVDEVVGAVTSDDMTAADKVTALNDWLVSNAEYDDAAFAEMQAQQAIPVGREPAWNATGTLLLGTGVCASYSYAFNALANAAGVETVVVSGDVFSGGAHAWNKVLVDGTWLAVDTTWNDGGDPSAYLMIPDSGFTGEAARAENDSWMIDSSIPAYATP